MTREILERRTAITGIGQSDVGRRLGRDPLALTLDACLAAIADAGLRPSDIDGLATYPGAMGGAPGFTGAGVTEVHDALRLKLDWFTGGMERPGQLGCVIDACAAVAAGYARHVLCFRSVWEGTAQGTGGRAGIGVGGGGGSFRAQGPTMEYTLPFRAYSAANWIALVAQRHFHEYGTTREQLAQIALNARRNAAGNPKAIYREPMTMEQYLGARMISTPFCLYDCDVPCDGGTPLRTTTEPRTGGCGTMAMSTCTTASAGGDEAWTYAVPSRVEVWRGTRVKGAAGAAGTGTL